MNNVLFQQARQAYVAKDYVSALEGFTQCLQGANTGDTLQAGELGLLYHQIGNCLMKLHDYEEAIHAYTQATTDNAYDGTGSVNCNLGNSYAALHDYENAVKHFEIAVSDNKYGTPYKAYSGMGKAYLKLGKSNEAGMAFRAAAVDSTNPNPAQALLNLGICFMSLNRPEDAIASYESALQFNMTPATKNKLYANLGQAYTTTGKMQKAVNAFEMALADKTYYLNYAASVDYQRAVGAVSQGTQVMDPITPGTTPGVTGALNDMSGLDVPADGTPQYFDTSVDQAEENPYYMTDAYNVQDNYTSSDDRFLRATDQEIEEYSRKIAKQDRKRRNVGLKILVTLIVLIVLVAGAGVVAYWQGFGYPTQQSVVQKVFADPSTASTSSFASSLSSDSIESMLNSIVADPNATIDGVDRSMNSSTVYVSAKTDEGGSVQYKVSLSRDGIGWKVSNIELYFPSQG